MTGADVRCPTAVDSFQRPELCVYRAEKFTCLAERRSLPAVMTGADVRARPPWPRCNNQSCVSTELRWLPAWTERRSLPAVMTGADVRCPTAVASLQQPALCLYRAEKFTDSLISLSLLYRPPAHWQSLREGRTASYHALLAPPGCTSLLCQLWAATQPTRCESS